MSAGWQALLQRKFQIDSFVCFFITQTLKMSTFCSSVHVLCKSFLQFIDRILHS